MTYAILLVIYSLLLVFFTVTWQRPHRLKAATSLKALKENVDSLAGEAVKEATAWKERAEANFHAIARIERQRNAWKDMYHQCGLEYAAAQEMLLREIQRLSILAKAEVSPHLSDLVAGYRKKHGEGLERQEAEVAVAGDTEARG